MSLTRIIAHQTILQLGAKTVSVLMGVFSLGILTRYLGQEGYGYYTTVFSFVVMFVIAADLGLYSVAITELGRGEIDGQKLFSNIMTIRILAALFAMVAAIAAMLFFPYPSIVKYGIAIVTVSTFANLLNQLHIVVLQKNLRTHWIAAGEIAEKAIVLVGVILAVRAHTTLLAILWIAVVGFLVHFAVIFSAAHRLLPYRLKYDCVVWKTIMAKAWPVAVSGICAMVYFKIDTIFISLLRPAASAQQEVGIYGAAYKIFEVLNTFPWVFLGLMTPQLSHAFSVGDRVRFERIIQKSFNFLSLIAWPLVGIVLVKAGPLIELIAGSDFSHSAPVLQILILAVGANYLTHFAVYATNAVQQQRKMTAYYVIATAGAIIAYALTIPRYSYFGAAWTTLAIEVYIGGMALFLVWRTMRFRLSLKVFWKAAFASACMVISMLIFDTNLFVSLIIGGLVYAGVVWFTKGVTKEQLQEILQLRAQTS